MTTVIVVSSYKDPERSKYSKHSLEFAQSDHFDLLVHLNKRSNFSQGKNWML